MRFLVGRAIRMATVLAVAAGVVLIGGTAAQAQTGGSCASFPGTTGDSTRELTICSYVNTYVSGGVKYVAGNGQTRIGSSWFTSATNCAITSWVSLGNGSSGWNTAKQTYSCENALDYRNTFSVGPTVRTGTTATTAVTWTCVDLYFNSTTSGWQRCEYSPLVYW